VHLLTCARDVLLALWSLKSFYYHSGLTTQLVIHDDGTLSDDMARIFREHFVNCEIIRKKDSDIEMKRYLSGHECCQKYRHESSLAHALKLFDFVYYSRAREILLLDSDVLFFGKPAEMLGYMKAKKGFFMNDYMDDYCLPIDLLQTSLHTAVCGRCNSGILYVPDKTMYDISTIESFLRIVYENWSQVNRIPEIFWIEQTAWAILLSKQEGVFVRLPTAYQIASEPITHETIAHHFVRGGVRNDFYTKGLREVKKSCCLNKRNKPV